MKFLITLLFFNFSHDFYAQDGSNFGFGASAGYKSSIGEVGFLAEYKFKKIADVYGGLSYGKYNSFGYALGTDIYFLRKQWQPYIGVGYNYQSGNSFYIGQTGVNRTDFKVNSSNSLIGSIGVRWIILFDDKTANGFMVFSPYISYRQTVEQNEVIYEGGIKNENAEQKINNRIGSGIGGGIKILYFINRNKKTSSSPNQI